ncbi:MAG: S8 family serine peptidase [Cyanobacteria bacterium P01_H01_bin.153]
MENYSNSAFELDGEPLLSSNFSSSISSDSKFSSGNITADKANKLAHTSDFTDSNQSLANFETLPPNSPDFVIPSGEKPLEATQLGYELMSLAQQYTLFQQLFGESVDRFSSANPLHQIDDNGRILVDVVAAGETSPLLAELTALGFEATGVFGTTVSGYLPMDTMMQMVGSETMQFMRPAYRPITSQGSITNQAVPVLGADTAQSQFGVSGAGVTVGILSDSFNNLGGAAADRATGDLPSVNVLQDLPGGGSDEGRAMAQLIFDSAPGADLAFQTAFLGKANFAQGIVDLRLQADADVIVDDVIYLDEPFFQDGIIAQAVDQVVADGAAYFSAAGNSGDRSYKSAYRGSGQFLNFGSFQVEAHDFDPGSGVDIFQDITIPVGAQVSLSFQWASPYFSASGNAGATSDLDIFLLNQFNQVVAASFDNNLNGDPVEVLNFQNSGFSSTEYKIAIGKFAGDDPALLKYVGFGPFTINEFDTQSSTLFGKANAQGAQAVGAVFFGDTPSFGNAAPVPQAFSARGGTPILFDAAGNSLATPQTRLKPEIVAPNGGNTTFFGDDIAADSDTFPNFFGTSAAAPNAAAVAALLKEVAPQATPQQIYTLLQQTALDLDDPSTPGFDAGFDNASGFGLIQADQAIAQVLVQQLPSLQPPLSQEISMSLTSQVQSGVTSVGLDLALLETAANLVLVSVENTETPVSDDFQVGFGITDASDFVYSISPFAPVSGTIEHTGILNLSIDGNDADAEVSIGNFSIGFDASRVSETNSGFFIADTLSDNGLDILFDIGNPAAVDVNARSLDLNEADLLVAPEFAAALTSLNLAATDLTGADVGDASVNADSNFSFGGYVNFNQFVQFQALDEGITVPNPEVEINGLQLNLLFDETFYLSTNPDVAQVVAAGALATGFDHFREFGLQEGRNPSLLFDEAFYLSQNPDVAAAVAANDLSSGLSHYLSFGSADGRDPSALFDESDYLLNNPDVQAAVDAGAFTNGFDHYLEFGAAEGRLPDLLLFQEGFYLEANADVAAAVEAGSLSSGFEHYVRFGQGEGRDPSQLFDESAYLATNLDVAAAVEAGGLSSGFEHFVKFGRAEGRAAIA